MNWRMVGVAVVVIGGGLVVIGGGLVLSPTPLGLGRADTWPCPSPGPFKEGMWLSMFIFMIGLAKKTPK